MASRIAKNALYVLYRISKNARSVHYGFGAPTGNRGAHTGSAPEYIECASLTNDKIFQAVFRSPNILRPFLNHLLVGNLIKDELVEIEVRGDEQQIVAANEYPTLHDVRARDADGNTFVIEMERTCGRFDIVRFQQIAFKVFTKLHDARAQKLREQAKKKAEAETMAKMKDAANTARAEAKAKKMNEADVDAAVEEATKKVEKVKPKRLSHADLYRPEDVPTVIVAVITDGGLPKKYDHQFKTKDEYVLIVSFDQFKEEGKVHFVYVDLERFSRSGKADHPITHLDHWCSLLWHSRSQRIKKELFRKLEVIEGIADVGKRVAELEHIEELKAVAEGDEVANERMRIAMALLRKKADLAMIAECTGYTLEELQQLKSAME